MTRSPKSSDPESPDEPPTGDRRRRLAASLRNAGRRGREELTRPGGIGDNAHGAFRNWCRRVWRSRGGGLYAVGFIVSFVYLEIVDVLFDDVPQIFQTDWLSGEAIGFGVDFMIDTLTNMISAFLWPVYMIQWEAPVGLVLLAALYFLFPRLVQKPVEHWMFEGKPAPDLAAEKQERMAQKAEARAEKRAQKHSARAKQKAMRRNRR